MGFDVSDDEVDEKYDQLTRPRGSHVSPSLTCSPEHVQEINRKRKAGFDDNAKDGALVDLNVFDSGESEAKVPLHHCPGIRHVFF
jgi:hypothetical protein